MDPTPDSVKMMKNLRQDKSWTPGKPTTIILLKVYSNEMIPNDLWLYP